MIRTECPFRQKCSSYCSTVSPTSRSRCVGMTNDNSLSCIKVLQTRPVYLSPAPRLCGNLPYIVAKDETKFSHGPGLVLESAVAAERAARSYAARMNIGKFAADEEATVLIGGRHGHRRAGAARAVHQIDRLIGGRTRAFDVLKAGGEREAVFESPAHQDRGRIGRCLLYNADTRVGWNIGVLPVGLDDPGRFVERVQHGVHRAVVLHRRGQTLKLRLRQVSHAYECQTVGSAGISQGAAQPTVAVGIEPVVPTQ